MVSCPTVHPSSATVGQLRAFFRDDHKHMALLAEDHQLVGTVERGDLTPQVGGDMPASAIARLDGRTLDPDALLSEAFDAMTRDGRRRLAVTSENSNLLGLLCLKASGLGFCSDADVTNRACLSEQSGMRSRG